MAVVSGRALYGAGSWLRALTGGTFALLSLIIGGCGHNTFHYGTAVVTASVTPGPFSIYYMGLAQVILTRTDNIQGIPVSIEQRTDFTRLNNMPELLGAPAIPEGTYTSATVTLDYSIAVAALDVSGANDFATLTDPSGASITAITYTVTFDPAHPLVITAGQSSPMDINFDLSASNIIQSATAPVKVVVKPMVTVSTQPTYSTPIRARGSFVTGQPNEGNFVVNTHPFLDQSGSTYGALTVQPTAQTAYTVNGQTYTGSAGLSAVSGLPISTAVAAIGTVGGLSGITPVFTATQVYAGLSVDSFVADHISGVVSKRQGNTLTLHGPLIYNHALLGTSGIPTSVLADLTVTVGSNTSVSIDGEPGATGVSIQSISVGQRLDISGIAAFDSNLKYTGFDATAGLVRIQPTSVWGTLNSGAAPGSATVNMLSLSNYGPAAFAFAGTGTTSAADANPAAYALNTGSIDESGTPINSLVRFDGQVSPFGSAPPDFTASAASLGAATDQILVVNWTSGSKAPFTSMGSSGVTLQVASGNLAAVRTGPQALDLTNPQVAVLVAPDPAVTLQLAVGNTGNGIKVFNSYASWLSAVTTLLNGTNAALNFVAVGHYNSATGTFTAHRMDLVQQ